MKKINKKQIREENELFTGLTECRSENKGE